MSEPTTAFAATSITAFAFAATFTSRETAVAAAPFCHYANSIQLWYF